MGVRRQSVILQLGVLVLLAIIISATAVQDECTTGTCGPGSCVEIQTGGTECTCPKGFAQPNCHAITCPPLPAPTNGNTPSCSNTNNFGSVCTFTCSDGFGIVGSSTLTCGGDGTSINGSYDNAAPICEDYNECEFMVACNTRATCINSIGSYRCVCNEGFDGDGFDVCHEKKCPRNQKYSECVPCLKVCGKGGKVTKEMCNRNCMPGCACPEELPFQTKKGKCVAECPAKKGKDKKPKCPKNQKYSDCATACPLVCGEPAPQICTAACEAGCTCTKNRWLRADGKCVKEKKCPK